MNLEHCADPSLKSLILPALWCLHTGLEYWLGRTEKFKSASVLEAILRVVLVVIVTAKEKLGVNEDSKTRERKDE